MKKLEKGFKTLKEQKEFKTMRAKSELAIYLYKTLNDFKSKEEPEITLTKKDVEQVLVGMLKRSLDE
jgi:hypothetical protein